MKDRSHYPVRKTTLAEQGIEDDLRGLSPSELVAMVWPLTVQAWAIHDPDACQRTLQRHVVRLERRGR
jgi:hypothetical protein